MVLSGLAQKFLESRLIADTLGSTRGVVLEVKEERGLGKTADIIIYDGKIDESDTIVIGAFPEPVIAKVRAILKPKPLREIREKHSKFDRVKSVSAAAGVKVVSPDLENVIAGMPVAEAKEESIEEVKKNIKEDIENVICRGKSGVAVKADSLGSLEAIKELLNREGIEIKVCGIGDVTKKDIVELETEEDMNRAVFAFNVGSTDDAKTLVKEKNIALFTSDIVYRLVEDYKDWKLNVIEKKKIEKLEKLMNISKIQVLPGYIFRQSNPAIVGIEVVGGKLKPGTTLMRTDGASVGKVKSVQDSGKNLEFAETGKNVAVSITGATYGKDFKETDILYSDITENNFKKLKELKSIISENDKELIREIQEIKRKGNPLWGM
jgi:translation initiation factor 5B